MIALDTNILVYAHRVDQEFHRVALDRLQGLIASGQPWAVPWPCVHEFISVTTSLRIYKTPTPMHVALAAVEAWMGSPRLVLLSEQTGAAEPAGYWLQFREIATASQVVGPRIHDARIAALCLQHGVGELWTADRDFGRFPALRAVNPLVA